MSKKMSKTETKAETEKDAGEKMDWSGEEEAAWLLLTLIFILPDYQALVFIYLFLPRLPEKYSRWSSLLNRGRERSFHQPWTRPSTAASRL